MRRDLIVLAFFLFVCMAVGELGSIFTHQGLVEWYPKLVKPAFTPPNWVFPPVWTFLYASMAIAAWLVYRTVGGFRNAPGTFLLFFLQLGVNLAWSYLFFTMRSPLFAFYDILILIILVSALITQFTKLCLPAGLLLYPYLFWLIYAAAINGTILYLNTGL